MDRSLSSDRTAVSPPHPDRQAYRNNLTLLPLRYVFSRQAAYTQLSHRAAWSITMASYALGAPLATNLGYLALFGVGALVMRGAGCTINDMWDKNLDKAVGTSMQAATSLVHANGAPRHRKDTGTTACARRSVAAPGVRVSRWTVGRRTRRTAPTELVQVSESESVQLSRVHLWSSILLGASSLSVVTIYPLMKRITYWPQAVLGMDPRVVV